jgi:hypothetical protein
MFESLGKGILGLQHAQQLNPAIFKEVGADPGLNLVFNLFLFVHVLRGPGIRAGLKLAARHRPSSGCYAQGSSNHQHYYLTLKTAQFS